MKRETHDFLSQVWEKHVKRCEQENVETYAVKCEEIEDWSIKNNKYIAITSMITGLPAYETNNFSQLAGFECGPDLSSNMFNLIRRIDTADFPGFHIGFELMYSLVIDSVIKGFDYQINHFNCGINYNNDHKGKIKLLYDFAYCGKTSEGSPIYSIMNFSDITEWFNGNFIWIKVESMNEKGDRDIKTYRNDTKEYHDKDFFNANEKLILKQLMSGKTLPEIAHINSKSEIELNNELTCLAKNLGAKNIESLVQLCMYCDFFNFDS